MSTSEASDTGPVPSGLTAQLLHPPIGEVRFWVVQAGVLALALFHDVVLVFLDAHDLAGVPAPTTSVLLLIPVIYAALNFGVRGAIGTALWATVLIVPHWFPTDDRTAAHISIEMGYLFVLNTVAVVVGLRVEREQRARRNAEDALHAARDAEARYHALFEDHPAAVIITDVTGVVLQANAAAARLLGEPLTGQPLASLLGVDVDALLGGRRAPFRLTRHDAETLLLPSAHQLFGADGAAMVQVVLADITEQHRRQEEQRLFARRLLGVQEDERRRLARELHDDPLQDLTYLTRTLDDLGHRPCDVDELRLQLTHGAAVADDAATSLRKIIQGLRPPVLDDLGLVSAVRQLIEEVRTRTEISIAFRVCGDPVRLGADLELAAYRIIQEALTNVARHAHASRAAVRLAFGGGLVTLTVTDDGVGIRATKAGEGARAPGLGLIGMRERINMAGGALHVSRRSPHGTRVHATLPLPPEPGSSC